MFLNRPCYLSYRSSTFQVACGLGNGISFPRKVYLRISANADQPRDNKSPSQAATCCLRAAFIILKRLELRESIDDLPQSKSSYTSYLSSGRHSLHSLADQSLARVGNHLWQLAGWLQSHRTCPRAKHHWGKCKQVSKRPSAYLILAFLGSTQQHPDDVVITLALRTPMCKASKGGLKDTSLDGLLFKTLTQVRLCSDLDPKLVDDICLGNVRNGKAAYYIRAAALASGYPYTTTTSSLARFCSSGLTATQFIANEIRTGVIDVGIAIGAESLSEGNERLSRPFVDEIMDASQDARDCMLPMGKSADSCCYFLSLRASMPPDPTRRPW